MGQVFKFDSVTNGSVISVFLVKFDKLFLQGIIFSVNGLKLGQVILLAYKGCLFLSAFKAVCDVFS